MNALYKITIQKLNNCMQKITFHGSAILRRKVLKFIG